MEKRIRILVVVAVCLIITIGILLAVFLSRDDNTRDKSSVTQPVPFSDAQQIGVVTSSYITEASGICASRRHKDVLYTHNDSGDRNRIYAISATNASLLAIITIDGATAKDWEDIACGPCTNASDLCVYIADTGGNAGGNAYTIFRIKEPTEIVDQKVALDAYLKFSWYMYDCETIMVDTHGEVYVVSKVCAGSNPLFQRVPSEAWNLENRTTVYGGVSVPISSKRLDPVAGDISPDGAEILLKTYEKMYYWYIPDGDYYAGMQTVPLNIPYSPEPQGEAVGFAANDDGYYTLSEGSNATLYYYRRIVDSSKTVIETTK